MKSTQEIVHWLEQGAGSRWLQLVAVALGGALLTVIFAWKQFHGLPTEFALQQADLARQISLGNGFTTRVNYPQTAAVLRVRGEPFREERLYPELHHAPLYALVMAAVLAPLPESAWQHRPEPPGGWAPDYAILALNLALLWVGIFFTWRVARRLFDDRVAAVATLATAVSVTLWEQAVVLSGMPLMLALSLALVDAVAGLELAEADGEGSLRAPILRPAVIGLLCGLLLLAEYSAGLMALVMAGYLLVRLADARRLVAVGVFAAAFALVAAPWLVRNAVVSGHPLGLAWQNLALKQGDSTAEPAAQRNLLSTEPPGLDVKKLGNKGLTGIESNLKERLWAGGGLMLTAFFCAGLAYQFRHGPTNRTRWVFAAILLVMLLGQPFFNSGESPRLPATYLAPLLIIFGTGFFFVLVDSQTQLSQHWRWAALGLLLLQGLPMVRDVLEPRRIHFHYPPYFPNLFMELAKDAKTRFLPGTAVCTDVPAGTAWYGQMRVWSKPARLRDFNAIMVDQPIGALLLTPVTLDRPFFTELAARREDTIRLTDAGGWGAVYSGLVTRSLPRNFALNLPPQRLTDNMVLLVNPATLRRRGN